MSRRMLLAVVAVSLTAVPAAHSAGTAARNCGTVRGGGATWSVLAAGVSCGSAKPLIGSLASKPRPSLATPLGTHLGLKCTELARGKTREIACVSADGRRSVFGVTPPRK